LNIKDTEEYKSSIKLLNKITMNKEFVPYEEALVLKELGFNEPCLAWFSDRNIRIVGVNGCALLSLPINSNFNGDDEFVTAPTYSQAFRWFREKYGLWQTVLQNTDVDWTYDILPINGIHDYKLIDVFETYEEAELACLIKLIEIVKQK
jgi:hypothetical protein